MGGGGAFPPFTARTAPRGILEHATQPGTNCFGERPRFGWEAPGGVDRASGGAAAHVLFPPDRLHEACRKGHLEEVLWLIDLADDERRRGVDDLDPGGRTPLHFAAGWGRMDVVAALLERGAALEIRDMWRKAPIDWALQADQEDAVTALRVEAVRRGIWGGRGRAAPLTTASEAVYGKTAEELQEEINAYSKQVFKEYAEADEREAKHQAAKTEEAMRAMSREREGV
jgi:hypothetical protein